MNAEVLTGLDGSNPLAYLAALGVLVALDERHEGVDAERPRLSWRLDGVWRPVLHSRFADLDAIVAELDADRLDVQFDPAIRFTYGDGAKHREDVKCTPAELRQALLGWVREVTPAQRRTTDWFTGFVAEGAVDNNGNAKPSALHFTAGQQQFLRAAGVLSEAVTQAHLLEALRGPWAYCGALPVLGWDNTESRDHALRARDPSTDKKLGNPGADWLALRGLALYPLAARRQRQHTPGVVGRWKQETLTWCLWGARADRKCASALIALPNLHQLSPGARARRGIEVVLCTAIHRSEQGGYGSVSPARSC